VTLDDQDLMDAEDAREVTLAGGVGSPAYPPVFSHPAGLSEEGNTAWATVTRVLLEQKATQAGVNRQVFVNPSEWPTQLDAELLVVHDGGDHAPYFNLDYGAYLNRAIMDGALREVGLYIEPLTPQHSMICRLPPGEEEIKLMERIVREDDEEGDEDLVKDVMPDFVEKAVDVIQGFGLKVVVQPDMPATSAWMHMCAEVPDKYPYASDERCWDQAGLLGEKINAEISQVTKHRVMTTPTFDIQVGKWVVHVFVNAFEVNESEEDEDDKEIAKDISEPATKIDRIQRLFTTMGLHISSTLEIPADAGWGDLGKPRRQILTYLQPDASKPFSTNPIATPEFVDFLRRTQSNLAEILETTEIDYSTEFRNDLHCWEIIWHIDDPEISRYREIAGESLKEDDDEDDENEDIDLHKEVERPPLQKGDIVCMPSSEWPTWLGKVDSCHGYGGVFNGRVYCWVVWDNDPKRPKGEFKYDVPYDGLVDSRQLELVIRPEAVGEAIVGWHASPNKFKKFNTSKEGSHFGTVEQASNVHKPGLRKPKAYALDIKHPLRLPDLGVWNNFNGLHAYLSNNNHISDEQSDAAWSAWQRSDDEGWEALKQALEQNGFDGVVYKNEQEGDGDSYIAFSSKQIKPVKESSQQEEQELVERVSIDEIIDYQKSIADKMEAAKLQAIEQELDQKEKTALEHGHGQYLGVCGHVIKQCRCSHGSKPVKVDAVCVQCSKKSKPTEECANCKIVRKDQVLENQEVQPRTFRGGERRIFVK
jgi:hypothetical protein